MLWPVNNTETDLLLGALHGSPVRKPEVEPIRTKFFQRRVHTLQLVALAAPRLQSVAPAMFDAHVVCSHFLVQPRHRHSVKLDSF